MAEDLLVGFKFNDLEDNMVEDAAIWAASDAMFNEAVFKGHEARVEKAANTADMKASVERTDDPDTFDFNEGFDFSF